MAKKNGNKKKGAGLVSIIFFILAMVCFAYGASVQSYFRSRSWFNFIWFIGGAVMLVFSFLFSHSTGLPRAVKWILGVLIIACLANFGIFTYRVIDMQLRQPPETADWVIVLGAKVNGTSPSTEFSARINKALEYAAPVISKEIVDPDNKHEMRIIATGGQGEDEGAAEAEVCASVLHDHGVPMLRILVENRSTTTRENLINAMEIIKANGGSENDKVLIVSSGFHLYRASKLAKALGYGNAEYLGGTGLPILVPHYIVREYAANIKENLMGSFGGSGGFFSRMFNGLF